MPVSETIEKLVDSLKTLQQITDLKIYNQDRKIEHMRKGVQLLGAGEFLSTRVMIMSDRVFAKNPDSPDERLILPNSVMFIGSLTLYSYIVLPEIPVDSLTLEFTEPAVIGMSPEEEAWLGQFTLQVPVLDIETCLSAELPGV